VYWKERKIVIRSEMGVHADNVADIVVRDIQSDTSTPSHFPPRARGARKGVGDVELLVQQAE
jgi:hypothetical protein